MNGSGGECGCGCGCGVIRMCVVVRRCGGVRGHPYPHS
jgi:hypothetical protein